MMACRKTRHWQTWSNEKINIVYNSQKCRTLKTNWTASSHASQEKWPRKKPRRFCPGPPASKTSREECRPPKRRKWRSSNSTSSHTTDGDDDQTCSAMFIFTSVQAEIFLLPDPTFLEGFYLNFQIPGHFSCKMTFMATLQALCTKIG